MDNTQIIVAVVIVGLVVAYVFLRKRGNQPSMYNLPVVQKPSTKNELENKGPQQ